MYLSFWSAVYELWRMVPQVEKDRVTERVWWHLRDEVNLKNEKRDQPDLEIRQPDLYVDQERKLATLRLVQSSKSLTTTHLIPILFRAIKSGELAVYGEDTRTRKAVRLPKSTFAKAEIGVGKPSVDRAEVWSAANTIIYRDIKILKTDLKKIQAKYLTKATYAGWHRDKGAVRAELKKWLVSFCNANAIHTKDQVTKIAVRLVSKLVTRNMVEEVWKHTPPEWQMQGRRPKR